MNNDNVLQVLMYLFQHHLEAGKGLSTEQQATIVPELKEAGFSIKQIDHAIHWVNRLQGDQQNEQNTQLGTSMRIYATREREILGDDAIATISSLEYIGILKPATREIVINLLMDIPSVGIDVPIVKWVTLMVLFSHPKEAAALANMEFLVLNNSLGGTH